MGNNPSEFNSTVGRSERVSGLSTDRFPVERVTWEVAVMFCQAFTSRARSPGILPTT